MWTELLKFLGAATVLLAAVAWLIRSLVSHLLNKDIEKYKFELRREAERELETLKAALKIQTSAHQIRFSKLHDRRADVIEELYKKIVAFESSASSLIAEFSLGYYDHQKQKADKFIDQYFDLHNFTERNAIYFTPDLTDKIKELNQLLFNLSINIYYQSTENNIKDFVAAFQKEQSSFESRNKEIKGVIESQFREMLGVGS
jgi:hypothetical protein